MATITAAAGGGNWTTGGTWVGGVAPTAADDVLLTATSGNVTINTSSALGRSLNCTGYTGTLTHTAGVTLSLGDATAGLGNVALTLVAGMTYTLGSNSCTIAFVSTSTTVQTIATGGKLLANLTINGIGSKYQLTDSNAHASVLSTTTLTAGQLDTNGQACSWGLFSSPTGGTRTLTLGASAVTMTGANTAVWNVGITGLTLNAGTSVITCTGINASFAASSQTYPTVVFSGPGVAIISSSGTTFGTLTRTGTAVKTDGFRAQFSFAVTGTLTLTGNSVTNRLFVNTSTVGTASVITAAAVSIANCDFMDITGAGAAAPFTGTSMGDALGNSGITFDASVTQTHTASAGGNWSDATKWTSRVPLPQDDVIVDANTTGTLTADMPRLGRTLTFTGFAGTLNATVSVTLYGSLTFAVGMVLSGNVGWALYGRALHTLTSAGKPFINSIQAFGTGTYTLQDDLVSGVTLDVRGLTIDANGHNVTIQNVSMTNGTLTMGAGTWNLTATTAINVWTVVAGTINAQTSSIVITTASANTRTFAGGGRTYNILTYTVAGSTGALAITNNNNTFNTINFSDISNARTLTLSGGLVNNVTNFNINGTAGKLMTINSSVPGTPAILSKSSGVVLCDYLSIQDSTATGGAAWYAGVNSVNVSGNSGWIFGTPGTAGTHTPDFLKFFGGDL